jgi:hypothetical protein
MMKKPLVKKPMMKKKKIMGGDCAHNGGTISGMNHGNMILKCAKCGAIL